MQQRPRYALPPPIRDPWKDITTIWDTIPRPTPYNEEATGRVDRKELCSVEAYFRKNIQLSLDAMTIPLFFGTFIIFMASVITWEVFLIAHPTKEFLYSPCSSWIFGRTSPPRTHLLYYTRRT